MHAKFGIILLPNFTLSALGMFLDPIRLAGDVRDGSQQRWLGWDIHTLSGEAVRSSCGVAIGPTAPLGSLDTSDYVAVVGGIIPSGWKGSSKLSEILRRCDRKGRSVIGLCTGAFSLIDADLLEDRVCSVSWFHAEEFVETFAGHTPNAVSQFHRSGRHYTCAGGLGAAYLSLSLIRERISESAARKAASILLIPLERISAEQPTLASNGVRSELLQQVLRVLEETIEDTVSMAELARRFGVSPRRIERAFQRELGRSPHVVREEMRIRRAKEMLAFSDIPLIEVAVACGYGSTGTMNRSFRRRGEDVPRRFREKSMRDPSPG